MGMITDFYITSDAVELESLDKKNKPMIIMSLNGQAHATSSECKLKANDAFRAWNSEIRLLVTTKFGAKL